MMMIGKAFSIRASLILLCTTSSCSAQRADSLPYIPNTEHQYYITFDVNDTLIYDVFEEYLDSKENRLVISDGALMKLELDSVNSAWKISEVTLSNKTVLDSQLVSSIDEKILSAINIVMEPEARAFYKVVGKPVVVYITIPPRPR